MRVRIFGKVTGERLAAALYDTLEQVREVHPGCQAYTANLYLKLFDAQGYPIATVDHEGKPLIATFPTPPGELNFPVVKPRTAPLPSGQSLQQADDRKDEESHQPAVSRAHSHPERWVDRRRRMLNELAATRQLHMVLQFTFATWAEATSRAIADDPNFTAELNQAFAEAWIEQGPVQAPGARNGVTMSPPVFSCEVGGGKKRLTLQLSTWKAPKVCKTPFGGFISEHLLETKLRRRPLGPPDQLDCFDLFVNHSAWRQACRAVMARMKAPDAA